MTRTEKEQQDAVLRQRWPARQEQAEPLTLEEWDGGTYEQRRHWLDVGRLVSREDAEILRQRALRGVSK